MRLWKWFKRDKSRDDGRLTVAQVEKIVAAAMGIAYNDGKRAGIEISKQAATKVIKEALWQESSFNEKRK